MDVDDDDDVTRREKRKKLRSKAFIDEDLRRRKQAMNYLMFTIKIN